MYLSTITEVFDWKYYMSILYSASYLPVYLPCTIMQLGSIWKKLCQMIIR